jgi:hypothetical protein
MAGANHGINQMETPSKRQPLNTCEDKLDKALGHAYAVMLPLSVYTRTSAPLLTGPVQSDTPSNAAPLSVLLPTFVTAAGHRVNAVMTPVLTLMRTTALALAGTNHTDCPSNTPPANEASLMPERLSGQPV